MAWIRQGQIYTDRELKNYIYIYFFLLYLYLYKCLKEAIKFCFLYLSILWTNFLPALDKKGPVSIAVEYIGACKDCLDRLEARQGCSQSYNGFLRNIFIWVFTQPQDLIIGVKGHVISNIFRDQNIIYLNRKKCLSNYLFLKPWLT